MQWNVLQVDGATDSHAPRQIGMTNSRTRTVPSSPLARVFGFGQLAAGLAMGTVAEAVRQSVRGGEGGDAGAEDGGGKHGKQGGKVKQYVASDANAERLAETLCRMRGAALKLGQMLSIQARKDVAQLVNVSSEPTGIYLVCTPAIDLSCVNNIPGMPVYGSHIFSPCLAYLVYGHLCTLIACSGCWALAGR